MRDRDCAFFVQREQHARSGVAEMIDQTVVQTAETRTRRERNVFDSQCAHHLGEVIAAPTGGGGLRSNGFVDLQGVLEFADAN